MKQKYKWKRAANKKQKTVQKIGLWKFVGPFEWVRN